MKAIEGIRALLLSLYYSPLILKTLYYNLYLLVIDPIASSYNRSWPVIIYWTNVPYTIDISLSWSYLIPYKRCLVDSISLLIRS